MELVRRWNPAVPRRWLLLLAGLLWTLVGGILLARGFGWFNSLQTSEIVLSVVAGLVLAFIASRFMLNKTAERNVDRITRLPEKSCVFAFTAWRGYALILLMIALGYTLRQSPLPKPYLAAMYIAMGGSLVLSSLLFYRSFRRVARA